MVQGVCIVGFEVRGSRFRDVGLEAVSREHGSRACRLIEIVLRAMMTRTPAACLVIHGLYRVDFRHQGGNANLNAIK